MISAILLILNVFFIIFFNKFSKLVNLFDNPDNKRKLHKKPIACIGGFLIFINLFIYFIFVQYNFFYLNILLPYFDNYDFCIFFLISIIFFLIGFIDDQFNLNANTKLILFSSVILLINSTNSG